MSLLFVVLIGCGRVVFVDPDAELKSRLGIVEAERWIIDQDPRSYVFARVAEREAVDRAELSLEGTAGRFAIPHEAIVLAPCSVGSTCFAVTLPPGIPPGLDRLILAVPDLGFETRRPLPEIQIGAYAIDAEALSGNRSIRAVIQDPIALRVARLDDERPLSSGGLRQFPRRFEVVIQSGSCGAKPDADAAWREVSTRFEIEAVFSDPEALACLAMRPAAPPGFGAAIQTTIGGRALVTAFDHLYSPPVEVGPLVFVPLFDLEIPNEARCAEAQNLIISAVRDAATAIASREETPADVVMIAPEQIAVRDGVPCRQTNDRTFDAAALGDRIEAALDAAFGPDRRVRVLVVFVNNLDLALPPAVITSLEELRSRFDLQSSTRRGMNVLAIASPQVAMAFDMAMLVPFSATAEPAFRESITRQLESSFWPHRTLLHTSETVVPLIDAAEPRIDLYQLCSSSLPVRVLGVQDRAALRSIDGVPAYTVDLPEQILVPAPSFERPAVNVRWEGCSGLCDRPAPGAASSSSWLRDGGCL